MSVIDPSCKAVTPCPPLPSPNTSSDLILSLNFYTMPGIEDLGCGDTNIRPSTRLLVVLSLVGFSQEPTGFLSPFCTSLCPPYSSWNYEILEGAFHVDMGLPESLQSIIPFQRAWLGVRMDVLLDQIPFMPLSYIYHVGCPWLTGSCMSPQTQKSNKSWCTCPLGIVQEVTRFQKLPQTLAEELLRWKEGMRSMKEQSEKVSSLCSSWKKMHILVEKSLQGDTQKWQERWRVKRRRKTM